MEGRRAEAHGGFLEIGAQCLQAGTDDRHHIRDGERYMPDHHGVDTPADTRPKEEDQHRRASDEPGDGDRRQQQDPQQGSPTKLPALQRQGCERPERGRDRRRRGGDNETVAGRRQKRAVFREHREPPQRRLDRQGVEGGGIESHRHHNGDRQIQEGDRRQQIDATKCDHSRSDRAPVPAERMRDEAAKMISTTASMVKDKAAPSGQLKAWTNWSSITVPMVTPTRPPRMRGSMKLPMTGTKMRMEPEINPGSDNGRMIFQKMTGVRAPRLRAAST